MNSENFENQLRSQPLRQPPAHWRGDILAAATQAGQTSPPSSQPSSGWWQTLIWPAPQAWGALAAVWIAILGLHYMGSESPTVAQSAQTPSPRQVEYALREKHRLYAELLSETETNPVAEPPRRSGPRPRSEAVPLLVFV